jgi:hypothetical protein
MAATPEKYLDDLIQTCRSVLDQMLILDRDERPARARLELSGRYGPYTVRPVEILRPDAQRKYAYYVLLGDQVVVGFDIAPDPRALRLKYGNDYTQHRLELVPHRHSESKSSLELTEEMDHTRFVAWLQERLPI